MTEKIAGRLYMVLALVIVLTLAFPWAAFADTQANTPALPTANVAVADDPDALDLKQQAIDVIQGMQYPNPELTAPGKDMRKQEILQALRASAEGLYRSQAFLESNDPFMQDVKAAKRLEQLAADPKNTADVKARSRQALTLLAQADRLLVTDLIDATGIFPQPFAKDVAGNIKRAQQVLADGDAKVAKNQRSAALADYEKAYRYVETAGKQLFAVNDPDGDQLLGSQELRLGTDARLADTDGDGLSDGSELLHTGTNPLLRDTGTTGTPDGEKDLDGDGLTNRREVALRTDPIVADTDNDDVSDGREVQLGTNPLRADTDDDGLRDDSEGRLGTNALDPDTDRDGILDGYESYTSHAASSDDAVSVDLTGFGDVAAQATFKSLRNDVRFKNIPGRISDAFDIEVADWFSDARVNFKFDPAKVPNGDTAGLRVMYYDELAHTFLPLDQQGVDLANGVAWGKTTHFSTYVLFYIPDWQAVWTTTSGGGPRGGDSGAFKNIDVMLTLDSSGSMTWNDPLGLRRTAAKQFVDALVTGDRVGVVDFDSWAHVASPLTQDFAAAKRAIDTIDESGGTNIGAGVSIANNELIAHSSPGHLRVQILLTDGDGSYSDAYTQQAKDSGITIYTIGLGDGVNSDLLSGIANQTGGAFYPVSSADGLPQVFRRIADGGGSLTDNDGDGLPDSQEVNGIRICTGELLKTDPNSQDTDNDGFTDLEELGQLQTVASGTCYTPTSNPVSVQSNPYAADSDGDGLLDADEKDLGTSPYDTDSDGDGLSDEVEVNDFGSDPLATNPDDDADDDAEEYAKDTDPFYKDLEGWEHAKAAAAGFVYGDGGDRAVKWHLMSRETHESMSYLAGWLASGYFGIGDVRDFGAAIWDARWGSAFLSAVGIVPIAGDTVKTFGVVRKFVSISSRLEAPVTRWIAKQFVDHDTTRRLLYRVVGANSAIDNLNDFTRDVLAKRRNKFGVIGRGLDTGRVFLRWATFSAADNAVISAKVARYWPEAQRAEGVAVESSVHLLQQRGYRVLYVGRPENVPGLNVQVIKGPDIVAVTPDGRTVVVEAKGANDTLYINNSLLEKKLKSQDGTRIEVTQPSRRWLSEGANERYLDALMASTGGNVREAARRLAAIIGNNDAYDAIVVGASRKARLGKVDETVQTLSEDANTNVEILALDVSVP